VLILTTEGDARLAATLKLPVLEAVRLGDGACSTCTSGPKKTRALQPFRLERNQNKPQRHQHGDRLRKQQPQATHGQGFSPVTSSSGALVCFMNICAAQTK